MFVCDGRVFAGSAYRHVRAALAVAFAIAAMALTGATSAQADCLPAPTADGQSIVCTGTTTAFDSGGFVGLNVLVQPGAVVNDAAFTPAINVTNGNVVVNNGTINNLSTDGAGIYVVSNNIVTNNNVINVDVTCGCGAGIQIDGLGTNNLITNNGTINVAGGPFNWAIGAGDFGGNTVINNNRINVSGFANAGIDAGSGNIILNNGAIVLDSLSTQGIAIESTGAGGNTITNSSTGTIVINGDDSIGLAGISGDILINNGSISTLGNGTIGIVADQALSATNNGNIVVGGGVDANGSSIGMLGFRATVTNSASGQIFVTGDTAIGMAAVGGFGFDAEAINNGRIVASGPSAVGMTGSALGNASTLTNNGTIIASGPNSAGVFVGGGLSGGGAYIGFAIPFDNSKLINNGLIQATGAGAIAVGSSSCGCGSLEVINNGTVDGRVLLQGGFADSFTNNGLLTVTTGPYTEHIVTGTFIQSATGTFAPRVSPDFVAGYDRLSNFEVPGSPVPPVLSGTLKGVVQPGLYAATQTYTNIVQYVPSTNDPANAISATPFDRVVSSSPFFVATVSTADRIDSGTSGPGTDTFLDSVDLTLTRIPFGSVPGETLNQQKVGNALESIYSQALTGNAAKLFGNLFAATSIGVLDNLSGEGTAALQNASFGAGSQFNNATLGQLVFGDTSGTTSIIIPPAQYAATPKPRGADAFDSVLKAPPAPATQTGRWRLWTVGFGAYRSIDGNASPIGSANQTIRNYGGAFGFDYQAAPDLLLGFAAGGSEANVSVPDRATTGRLTGGYLGVYGLKTWGATYLAASANYARFDNSTTRTIAGIGPTETAMGSFASDQLSARLELGWKRAFANYTLTPFVAIEPAALWAHGYTETSTTLGGAPGVLGLSFAQRTITSLPTFLGMQADTPRGLPQRRGGVALRAGLVGA